MDFLSLASPVARLHFSLSYSLESLTLIFGRNHDHTRHLIFRGIPKVMINKAAKARNAWRLSAFADESGGIAQNWIAIWPENEDDLLALVAVLNGPVANAFVTDHEGKTDITIETVKRIPFPQFRPKQKLLLAQLIHQYIAETSLKPIRNDPHTTLQMIDAVTLEAYNLASRPEPQSVGLFSKERTVPFSFPAISRQILSH